MADNGFLGGLSGILSGIIGASAQSKENRKNREWNLMLARKQNEWNVEQWNRENAYNTPAAQMSRLARGGLNPDLVYGEGASALAAESPEMTSGYGSMPANLSAGIQTVSQGIQLAAQTDLLESQAEKNRADAKLASSQEFVNESLINLNESQINLNKGSLRVQLTQADKNEMESRYFKKQVEMLDSQISLNESRIDEIRASISNLELRTVSQRIENYFKSSILRSTLKKLNAEVDMIQRLARKYSAETAVLGEQKYLTRQQFNNACQTYVINELTKEGKVNHLENLANFLGELGIKTQIESDVLQIDADWRVAEKILNLVSGVTAAAKNVGSMIAAPTKVSGFR